MHTQAGIKERFLNDLTETTAKLVKEGNKALTGRVTKKKKNHRKEMSNVN